MDACLGGVHINGPSLPPGVTLDLNFMNPGALDPRITFTRASSAAYIDASGFIQMAATNAPRWDYDPVTHALRGLLIEEARTNVVLNSGDVSNVSWGKGTGGGSTAPVVTANQTTSPDGTLTASRVVYPAVSAGGAFSVINPVASLVTTANPYSMSVWLKGAAGGEQLWLSMTPDAVTWYRASATLTTQWQRFVLSTPNLTAATWFFEIGIDRRDASQTSTPAQTVFMWGGQIEQGAWVSSLIPTTSAAVTRAIDTCGIAAANTSWFTPPGGSWFTELIPFNANRVVGHPVPGGLSPFFIGGGLLLSQFEGTALPSVASPPFVLNTICKGATSLGASIARECARGGPVASSSATGAYAFNTAGVGFLTTSGAGGTENTSGCLRRVSYWPRVLSDTEMQQVTT